MSRKPRPSLESTYAGIRELSQSREPAATPPRGHAETLAREPAATLARSHVSTLPREPAATRSREHVEAPKGFNVRKARVEKPHQSIYAHPHVFREIRRIAAVEDVKPQDLYREALRLMLAKRGLDFDALDAGQA